MLNRLILILTGITILTISSCSTSSTSKVSSSEASVENKNNLKGTYTISIKQFETSAMKFSTIKKHLFNEKVETQGYIDVPPSHKAKVSSFFPGKVSKINILLGDRVLKGQELLRISDPSYIDLEKNYLIAKSNIEYLKKEFQRQKTLSSDSISAIKVFQSVKNKYTAAMATYKNLKRKLQLLNLNLSQIENGNFQSEISIPAPISGDITMLNVTLGSHIKSSTILMEIINNSHEHLELNVFEKDILKIKKGQQIEFSIPDISDEKFKGIVKLIGKAIDPETRTIKVHGHMENRHPRFITGMYVNASIITKSTFKLSVPESALIKQEENYYILILKEKTSKNYILEKKLVIPGLTNNSFVQISGNPNIKKNMRVLSKGALNIL